APGGRSEQHQIYLDQALIFAQQAAEQSDLALQRNAWEQTLYWLDQADAFGVSDPSRAMRVQVQGALDALDGISRLVLQPVLPGSLGSEVDVSQIIATATDVFLLEHNSGRVLRLFQTSHGYELDQKFECGPGPSGAILINPFVGMARAPANNEDQASIVAVDPNGNLAKCKPGEYPTTKTLPLPDVGWGKIVSIKLDQGILYVLDQKNNRVWMYASNNLRFGEAPRQYFDVDVPKLTNLVDLAVSREDMFLLHDDGTMTRCTFRSFAAPETKCTAPAIYGDTRLGRNPEVTSFPDARFVKLIATQPPDPSLYVLDTQELSIYHFSLRLNLVRQIMIESGRGIHLPATAPTAFAVTPGQMVFIAFGNQLYAASLP
ncbi:MAG: hypothetical protein U1B80_08000, partial [Anaerolineaceae bacterium]|nr:hypothetical protein [Anaerolineaceae bacterium]